MGFTVYQMDVKSAFLYDTVGEEVYVHQPPGFIDYAHPNKVYKVIKALYGLHQAPRAWYETLSSFLLENGFRRGTIDKTLFIKKNKSDIMLVQVYVDDIIFGSTKQSMCTEFEDSDILKKFDFWSIRTATTPIESNKPLVKDEDGVDVDVHVYRFQVTPKASHLNAVKRIFRYLKHQPKLGLWYPKDSPFELEAFSDSDYGGANLDRKSTTGGCQFLGKRLISWTSIDLRMDGRCADSFSHNWSMANLKYSKKHNMVAFQKKPTKSEGFTEIVDFLKGSSLMYALTHNPTIYDSLVKLFWQTATVRTLANGIQELVASIDNKEYTIIEASVKSKLQLADATGINNLPDAEIYKGLATLGIMDTTQAQQKALDDALVAPDNRLNIRNCNLRLSSTLKSKEPTLQVVLDALKLTLVFKAFEITADICPKLLGQKFEDPPFEEEILSFIRDLGHTGEIKVLTDVNVNHMHQPWISFAAIINKCLSGKTTALESLCLSRAQILWGMYHNKHVDYVYLLWEDLVYQVKNNDMYYPCFTKSHCRLLHDKRSVNSKEKQDVLAHC
ncbi:putative ribonuclease H-like domain-containing protein [Tanacetum coccineum]